MVCPESSRRRHQPPPLSAQIGASGNYKKPSPSPGGGRGLGLGCSQNIIPDHKSMYLEAHSAPRHSRFQPLVTLCHVLVCKGLNGVLVWYRLLQDGSACLCTAWSVRLLGVGVSGGGRRPPYPLDARFMRFCGSPLRLHRSGSEPRGLRVALGPRGEHGRAFGLG
jgi:hypothetical protein